MEEVIKCKFFNGYKPCKNQKSEAGLICNFDCKHKSLSEKRILVIKRGAIGEVLRCTTILHRLKNEYPEHEIWWLTDYPDMLSDEWVDKKIKFNFENYISLLDVEFDVVFSLDKEISCASLANKIKANVKKGYHQQDFKILPIDKDAEYLWKRGIDDKFMKNDKRHYMDEIFEVCGYGFNEEEYILPEFTIPNEAKDVLSTGKKIIGFNTGTSATWKTRLWKKENWLDLAKNLISKGYEVVLLGGPDEHELNTYIAGNSEAKYFGLMNFKNFIGLVSLIDLMVTQVTFAKHVAVALKKKTVLLNNIFNVNEYYFYDIPYEALEPDIGCKMCYKPNFDSRCEVKNCMEMITPDMVFESVERLINS